MFHSLASFPRASISFLSLSLRRIPEAELSRLHADRLFIRTGITELSRPIKRAFSITDRTRTTVADSVNITRVHAPMYRATCYVIFMNGVVGIFYAIYVTSRLPREINVLLTFLGDLFPARPDHDDFYPLEVSFSPTKRRSKRSSLSRSTMMACYDVGNYLLVPQRSRLSIVRKVHVQRYVCWFRIVRNVICQKFVRSWRFRFCLRVPFPRSERKQYE